MYKFAQISLNLNKNNYVKHKNKLNLIIKHRYSSTLGNDIFNFIDKYLFEKLIGNLDRLLGSGLSTETSGT